MDIEEQIALDYCGLTKEELNQKRNYIEDYKAIKKSLDRFYGSVEDEELKETIIEMERIFDEQESKKFKDCVDKVDEFDTFDINDINDTKSLERQLNDEAIRGL